MPQENNGKTFRFDVCSQCKSVCCQDAKPPLTEQRQEIIKQYLQQQKIKLSDPFSHGEYVYPSVDEHLFCSLFNKKTGKCLVHPVKPETCKAGPITFDINCKTQRLEWFLKKSEICRLAGELFSDSGFNSYFEAAKVEIRGLVEQLSADELRALMRIEEPCTFKICEEPLSAAVKRKLSLL
jgi:uncharacterized protein